MTTIVTRSGKGSPLTHTEVDTNFTNLNTAKLETAAIPLGTLQAPSISFLNYSTTGIYSPAGNELGVSMLGSDKIRIKSTGEIIINATASRTTLGITPRLQIEGSASSSQCSMSLTGAGAGSSLIPRLYLSKARSSVNAVVLEDDILGFILFNGGDGSSLVNAGFIKAEVDGTPSAGIVPGRLVFATVDTAGASGERMIIKNNGNVSIDGTTFHVDAVNNRVGIGTSSPWTRMEIRSANVANGVAANTFATPPANLFVGSSSGFALDDGGSIALGGNTNSSSVYSAYGAIAGRRSSALGYIYDGYLTFSTAASDTLQERMRITSAGLVGIGTTGPGELLTVNGADQSILVRTSSLNGSARIKFNADDGNFAGIGLESSALVMRCSNSSTPTERARIRADGMFEVKGAGTAGSSPAFSVNGSAPANSAIIDTSGRLLVGTTDGAGLISNISPVVAGAFKSHSGNVTIPASTTVTIFTIPASNGEGAYTVTAIYVGSNNVATFSAYAVILYDGSATNAYRALGFDGGLLSITVSGRNVQLTTGATYEQFIKWSFVKQAVV